MNDLTRYASVVGLGFECIASIVIATLFIVLTASVRRADFASWSRAWTALAVMITSLLVALCVPLVAPFFFATCLFAGFLFGFFFLNGSRIFGGKGELDRFRKRWFYGAALAAVGLAFVDQLAVLCAIQSGYLAAIYIAGGWLILRARRRTALAGRRILLFACCLLAVNAIHYLVVFAYFGLSNSALGLSQHFEYSTLNDLLMHVILAFGMVVLVMEDIRAELESTNKQLNEASVHLHALAKRDPLTEALNRHAFNSMLRGNGLPPVPATDDCSTTPSGGDTVTQQLDRIFSGAVVVVDIDDLKPINDTYGHSAGDAAIRAVAKAIRSLIRADDLLFRWGGDEFLAVLLGLSAGEARPRFERINQALSMVSLRGVEKPVDIHVSFGIAPFEIATALDQAIEQADVEMYSLKQAYKSARGGMGASPAR